MEAPRIRERAPRPMASRFGESVFRSQVLLAGAVSLVVLCVTLAAPSDGLDESATFFLGLTTIIWITIISAIVPWLRFPMRWQMVVPLLDIVAIALLRMAEPQSGFGILLVFPVIWLATSFGRTGAIAGPALASVLLFGQSILSELDVLTTTGTTPVSAASLATALSFVAGVTSTTSRRVEAQRVLLRRQTDVLDRALRRARIQEATVRETFDAVEFAVISLDQDGRTLTSNRAARALLAELDLPRSTPFDRFPLYRADKITPVPPEEFPHLRVLAGRTVESETYWIGHRTGTRFTIDVTARLLHNESGEVDRAVVVLRDVSAEVRAIADRDDLVTSMSHELRTPLSSILGYVDLALETDGLPEDARGMLDIALANTQRLNSLVSDLLAARSTSPANAITLRPAACDVSALVRESVDAIRPLAGERMVAISLDIDEAAKAVVDAFRLRQVTDNLLSNAVKYNRTGGRITVAVTTSTDDQKAVVEIRVADTGRGMSLEEQKGLFERFYRAESVRGSTVHGTGLGLSISREIVLLHHGTIEVDSEAGRGTEVVVRIPVVRPVPTRPDQPTEES